MRPIVMDESLSKVGLEESFGALVTCDCDLAYSLQTFFVIVFASHFFCRCSLQVASCACNGTPTSLLTGLCQSTAASAN